MLASNFSTGGPKGEVASDGKGISTHIARILCKFMYISFSMGNTRLGGSDRNMYMYSLPSNSVSTRNVV